MRSLLVVVASGISSSKMTQNTNDDIDLEDLINADGPESRKVVVPLELGVGFRKGASQFPFMNFVAVTIPMKSNRRGSSLLSSGPRICVLCTVLCAIATFMAVTCFGGRGEKRSDFTDVNSIGDLKLSFIHHWYV